VPFLSCPKQCDNLERGVVILRKQIICLLMFVVMIVVAGCGGSKSATSEKTPKDTLVVGLPVDLASIDPAVAMDNKPGR